MLTIEWVGPQWMKWACVGLLLAGSGLCLWLVWWLATWEPDWTPQGDDDE